MTGTGSMEVQPATDRQDQLERRYRRWMVVFPRDYRASREDELVAVLLDAASPGQGRPSVGEVVDLTRAGLVTRVRAFRASPRPEAWSDATAVVGIVLAMVLAATSMRYAVLGARQAISSYPGTFGVVAFPGLPSPLAWLAVVVAVVLGRTRLIRFAACAALLVSFGVAGTMIAAAGYFSVDSMVNQLALSVIATAALCRRDRLAAAIRIIGRGRLAAVAVVVIAANVARLIGINNEVIVAVAAAILLAPRSWRRDVWSMRNHPAGPRIATIAIVLGVMVTGVPMPGGRTVPEIAAATAYDLVQTAVVVLLLGAVVAGLRAVPFRIVRHGGAVQR